MTAKYTDHIHDLAEFFREKAAPIHESIGAAKVAQELTNRGMKEAAAVAIQVGAQLIAGEERSLGIVAAVKRAIEADCDSRWMTYVDQSPEWRHWMYEDTHDQADAAQMRLCLDKDPVIRRIFLRGDS